MLRVPGIGTIHGCWANSHASAIWEGVAPSCAPNFLKGNDRLVRCHVFRAEAIEPGSEVRLRI